MANKQTREERRQVSALLSEGLTVKKHRGRHDPTAAPAGHEISPTGWPEPKPKNTTREVSAEDRELAHALIRATKHAVGEVLGNEAPATVVVMTDAKRNALEHAYLTLVGRPFRESDADRAEWKLEQNLANLLRARAQARVYKRVRQHKRLQGNPAVDGANLTLVEHRKGEMVVVETKFFPGVAQTPSQIVAALHEMGALTSLTPAQISALTNAIAGIHDEDVNLSGGGGPNGGKTPESCAKLAMLALRDPQKLKRELKAKVEKKRKRRGAEEPKRAT